MTVRDEFFRATKRPNKDNTTNSDKKLSPVYISPPAHQIKNFDFESELAWFNKGWSGVLKLAVDNAGSQGVRKLLTLNLDGQGRGKPEYARQFLLFPDFQGEGLRLYDTLNETRKGFSGVSIQFDDMSQFNDKMSIMIQKYVVGLPAELRHKVQNRHAALKQVSDTITNTLDCV